MITETRIFVGATHAYACIKTDNGTSLDVQLPGGRGAQDDLLRIAAEWEKKAADLIRRAALVRAAAPRFAISA